MAWEALSETLGRMFEPHVVSVLPLLLSCVADGSGGVRHAAVSAAGESATELGQGGVGGKGGISSPGDGIRSEGECGTRRYLPQVRTEIEPGQNGLGRGPKLWGMEKAPSTPAHPPPHPQPVNTACRARAENRLDARSTFVGRVARVPLRSPAPHRGDSCPPPRPGTPDAHTP